MNLFRGETPPLQRLRYDNQAAPGSPIGSSQNEENGGEPGCNTALVGNSELPDSPIVPLRQDGSQRKRSYLRLQHWMIKASLTPADVKYLQSYIAGLYHLPEGHKNKLRLVSNVPFL